MLPSAFPSPNNICSSSTNNITPPWASWTSFKTDFRRSSKSPLNLAPAIIWPKSRLTTLFLFILSGTSPCIMRWESPSMIAVFPTPAEPVSTGLFFVLLDRTCSNRCMTASLPITGSSLPSRASCVKSTPYCSKAGFSCSRPTLSGKLGPPLEWRWNTLSWSRPCRRNLGEIWVMGICRGLIEEVGFLEYMQFFQTERRIRDGRGVEHRKAILCAIQ